MLVHFARIRASDTVGLGADSPLTQPTIGLLLLPTLAFVVMHVSSVTVHCLVADVRGVACWMIFGLGLLVFWLNSFTVVFAIAAGLFLLDQAGIKRSLRGLDFFRPRRRG